MRALNSLKSQRKHMKHFMTTQTAISLALSLVISNSALAQEKPTSTSKKPSKSAETTQKDFVAVLPTAKVEAMQEDNVTKGYINYQDAMVTRNNLSVKETPQSIETLHIQKNKNYGTHDLSSIVEGNAGIDTSYDMRSDNIYIRGFRADSNDIYRDGIRESGQVRRSTANIERVEVLKGPASLLYGRSNGGGVINMVSKYANFKNQKSLGISYGSWSSLGLNFDANQTINNHFAVRLVGDVTQANSFRDRIDNKSRMFSPSVTYDSGNGLNWTGQYTYDYAYRTPDRGPTKAEYDRMGISYRQSFARPGDFVEDDTQTFRSNLDIELSDNWSLNWLAAYRNAAQNFDHYYSGRFNSTTRLFSQNYAWQETDNKTISSALTLNGEFSTGDIEHQLTAGLDISRENREPYVGYTRSTTPIDPYNPASWSRTDSAPAVFDNIHKAKSQGLFIQDVIALTSELKWVLGGRYDQYTFDSTDKNQNNSHYSGHAFSPSTGIIWEVNESHTLYGSYNKSFTAYGGNGYIGVSASGNQEAFNQEPEHNEQFEFGIKSDWYDGRLSTSLAAYQIERNNIRYQPDRNNDPFTWAVRGKERSRGVELSATGKIASNLYLRTSVGSMNGRVVEDKQNPHYVGNRLNGTANFNGNLFLRYVSNDQWYGELGITHVGKRYYYDRRGNETTLDSFDRIDALIGWKGDDWNATLGISNLFDKDYWRSEAMPGQPRSGTIRLNYQF